MQHVQHFFTNSTKTLQHLTQLYRTLQNKPTILYTTLHHFHKTRQHYTTTLHICTNIYTTQYTFKQLYNPFTTLHISSQQIHVQSSTQLFYNNKNYTQLYTTLHNYTQLYKYLQIFTNTNRPHYNILTKLYNTFSQLNNIVQNYTQLYTILHNLTELY